MYSNPPLHGARIVDTILGSNELTELWKKDLIVMSSRIKQMRRAIVSGIQENGSPFDWSYMERQNGMFAYTGFNGE